MSKFMLMLSLLLGSLAGLGSASQANEAASLAKQVEAGSLFQADYYVGQPVWIFWPKSGKWYPGHILKAEAGAYFVHYAGYGPEWDEWVGPGSLQPR
jgi:hypothetical protein